MTIEDTVLRELHRAAAEADRRGISIPSVDLDVVARRAADRAAAAQAVTRLIRAKRVMRVRRDLLVLPDTTGLLGVEIGDLVGAVADEPYLITAGAALEHAGLTDQHFFGLAVLVPTDVTELHYRGQTASFFRADATNIWGGQPDTRPRYALGERAILDAVNHPRYGVSLALAISALERAVARDSGFLDRLHSAVLHYSAGTRGHSSRSSARRVGLIIDRLFGADVAAPYRSLIGENRAPVLLRPGGSPDGPIDTTWRVVVNATVEAERSA